MRLAVGLQLAAAVRRTPIATARAGWAAGLHTACHPLPTPRLSTSTISLAARPTTVFRHPAAPTTAPLSLGAHPCAPCSQSLLLRRAFHSSSRRSDVFFASIPAIKSGLLTITRFSLLFLPFVFRYRLWKKYKRTAWLLIQIPIFAICIVIALGLDQCPRTGRWRLLLMSPGEELAWSHRKHKDVLLHDGPLLLPPEDIRSVKVGRVVTRIVEALEEQEGNVVCGATWPPREDKKRASQEDDSRINRYVPSATATSGFMPFRPMSSNPLKDQNIEAADWNIYVIDLPLLNAFALPSKEVFIYTGLLDLLPDDDPMLAAVLSHEIAHVTQRHSVENAGFLNLAAVAFDVLRGISFALTISFPFITDSAGMFINWLNDVVAERAYSRTLEKEADAVGLELMALAGYDPRAMADLWELMHCVELDEAASGRSQSLDARVPLLRTHPTSEERQDAIAALMPRALVMWKKHQHRPSKATVQEEVDAIQKELAALDVTEHPAHTV